MRKVFLISCVKKKRIGYYPAKLLYVSPLFFGMIRYALRNGDDIYIMSAKHGLVGLDDKISDYDETLVGASSVEKVEWAKTVFRQFSDMFSPSDVDLVLLGGKNYYEFLEKFLADAGFSVSVPMRGLSIGRMLSWLKNN